MNESTINDGSIGTLSERFNLLLNKVEENSNNCSNISRKEYHKNDRIQKNFRSSFSNCLSYCYRNKTNIYLNSEQNLKLQLNSYSNWSKQSTNVVILMTILVQHKMIV